MGNKPFRIALKVDELSCQAGEVLTGTVYLSVSKRDLGGLRDVNGIQLRFEGYEHVEVERRASKHSDHKCAKDGGGRIDKAGHSLVKMDYPLVMFTRTKPLEPGQFEYPFQLPVPADLPSSLRCTHKDRRSFGEIRYTLTAHLASPYFHNSPQNASQRSASSVVAVAARPYPVDTRPLQMSTEIFPVHACCFFNRGHLELGWMADQATSHASGEVRVQITGRNRSALKVTSLSAAWMETVTIATPTDNRRDVSRVLAKQSVAVDHVAQWQPKNHALLPTGPTELKLTLPADARDSYTGALVRVRHMLVVTAETDGGLATTSPQLSSQVKIVPAGSVGGSLFDSVPDMPVEPAASEIPVASVPDATPGATDVPHAQALPEDWNPVAADVISIPMAAAILVEDDGAPMMDWPSPNADTAASAPLDTAYPETSGHSNASAPPDFLDGGASVPTTGMEELQTMIRDCPENLPVVLEDPTWATSVQNLSPREFSAVLQKSGPRAPVAARALGICMGPRLRSRHVLACLWTLPDSTRFEVLRQLAPLLSLSDRAQMEQELDHNELIHFRTALRN